VQRTVTAQPVDVRESLGAHQHRDQKRGECRRRIDVVGRLPLDRHVLPELPSQVDLPQIGNEDGYPAEGRHGAPGLAQDQPLIGVKRQNLGRDRFVPAR